MTVYCIWNRTKEVLLGIVATEERAKYLVEKLLKSSDVYYYTKEEVLQ